MLKQLYFVYVGLKYIVKIIFACFFLLFAVAPRKVPSIYAARLCVSQTCRKSKAGIRVRMLKKVPRTLSY